MRKLMSALALGAVAVTMSAASTAQDKWPLVAGDYWEVTGIDIKNGGGQSYAQFIAGEWKDNLEFSKAQGWIKGYAIFSNIHARAGVFSWAGRYLPALPRGTSATTRVGPPDPPSIFIGSASRIAPRGGRDSRPVRFSRPGTLAAAAMRCTRKSALGP